MLGYGTHLLLVKPGPAHEQGLREGARDGRSVHVRGDDALDGEAVGPLMSLFRRFLRAFARVLVGDEG